MPVSRYSGPTFNAFAKGGSHGVLAWFTVTSSNDCRMANGGVLRTRIIVQNACAQTKEKVSVLMSQVAVQVRDMGLFVLTDDDNGRHTWCTTSGMPNASMRARARNRARAHAAVATQEQTCRVSMAPHQRPIHFKAKHTLSQYESQQEQLQTQREQLSLCENGDHHHHGSDPLMMSDSFTSRRKSFMRRTKRDDALGRDDFLVMFVDVKIAGPDFEIEALERLEKVIVPVVVDGVTVPIVCKMSERIIWDAYELLPGGWWARVG